MGEPASGMTVETFRRLALARPDAVESAHLGAIDFRVGGKIFATLGGAAGRPVVKLTPEEQDLLTAAAPAIFTPADGRWGRFGWTHLNLSALDEATAEDALNRSWRNVAGSRKTKAS
jgi:hypothetical protein